MPISWKLHNAANAVAPFFLHSIPKGERMLAQIVLKDREPLSDLVDLVRKNYALSRKPLRKRYA